MATEAMAVAASQEILGPCPKRGVAQVRWTSKCQAAPAQSQFEALQMRRTASKQSQESGHSSPAATSRQASAELRAAAENFSCSPPSPARERGRPYREHRVGTSPRAGYCDDSPSPLAERGSPKLDGTGRRPATPGQAVAKRLPPKMPGTAQCQRACDSPEEPPSPSGWSNASVSRGSLRKKLSTAELEAIEIETKRLEVQRMLQRNRRYMEAVRASSGDRRQSFDASTPRAASPPSQVSTPVREVAAEDCEMDDEFAVQRITFSPEEGLHNRVMSPSSCRRFRMF